MKRHIYKISWVISLAILFSSCEDFLKEEPKTFLSPDFYFTSEDQIKAAVNGIYTFLDNRFDGDIGPGTQNYLIFEYLPGYGDRPASSGNIDLNQAITLTIAEDNLYVERIWETNYKAIENCNSVIEGIEKAGAEVIANDKKNILLGEVYFLRGYHYFNLVRLFGEVPLKLTSTKNLSDVVSELSSIDAVYSQIEKDLLKADSLMANNVWQSVEGRVAKGTVKSLLSEVYLTMAGYPLQKGAAYFEKAYNKAKEVVDSKQYYLFSNYAALREPANENSGEFIWMIQRHEQYEGSPVHTNMLPYPEPEKPISTNHVNGGALAPAQAFYDSYTPGDLRVAEQGYYYTQHEALDKSGIVNLDRPYIYKFWDSRAAETGKSGANYPLIRYADVLLILAEAKAQMDGGSTNDVDAIDAYWAVRGRANPAEGKPALISANDVLKERFWELAFEGHTWFDMLRTRKAFNVITGQIVDLIGYEAPAHPEGHKFEEDDLLFPYPLREKRLNPNLVRG